MARAVIEHAQLSTPPPKHMRVRGNGRPGQVFDPERFARLCEEKGKDPAAALLDLLDGRADELKAKELADIYTRLMEYLYPKQRAVEHSGEIGLGLPELLERADEEWSNR